jgi:Reverse transcriptase (RNA-dependent DNA polymerase)
VFSRIGEVKPCFFTSLDWTSSFYQIALDKESQDIAAFSSMSKHVAFKRLPMGTRLSPANFLAAVYRIFGAEEIRTNMAAYMDEALIFHSNFDEHLAFIRQVFSKVRSANLCLNPRKSFLAKEKIVFLGFEFSSNGYELILKGLRRFVI